MSKDLQSQRLFNLLAISLAVRQQETYLFENMYADDWQNLMDLCARQGVLAVCFEAIEKCEVRPPLDELIDWLGQTSYIESQYESHLATVKELCSEWAKAGIPTMVFKGVAHSRYYHIPSHREFGDFDCYQFGKTSEGNKVAIELGAKMYDDWYKHSKIIYPGSPSTNSRQVTIENHRFFSAVRSNRYAKALNDYMVSSLGDGSHLSKFEGTDILLPSLDVEGLFMLHHSMRHFLEEGFNVKHFCDWAYWLRTNEKRINWCNFYSNCKEFGLDGFVEVMNNIVKRYLYLTIDAKINCSDDFIADKVVENTLYEDTSIHNKGRGHWYERIHLITNALRYSWKYSDVAHCSMIDYLLSYVKGFVFREEER